MIRNAISPRLATRIFLNIRLNEILFVLERLPGLVRSSVDPLQAKLQFGRVGAIPERRLEIDLSLRMMLHDRLVEGLHAVLGDTLLDRRLDQRRLFGIQKVLAD